jgi:MscS family membrane protein
VQRKYIEIAKEVGLELVGDRQKKRKRTSLEEAQGMVGKDTLIGAVRIWCKIWLEDPNMIDEDDRVLPQEWERKIYLLKGRMNRMYQKFVNPQGDETRLDDYVDIFIRWLNEEFKDYQNEWQEPKIRMEDIAGSQTQFVVKYYVDNITLEHCERGYRVNSEVRREMVRKLREAYLYS